VQELWLSVVLWVINSLVEQRFTVPLGGFTFKGFIDRVDMYLVPRMRSRSLIKRPENQNPDPMHAQNNFCFMPGVLSMFILNIK